MDWLWNVLAAAAPVIGNAIAPGIGGIIGSGVGALIGSFQNQSAANQSEQAMLDAARQQQLLAQQALNNVNMAADVRQLTKTGVDALGGSLAASGLLGSSIGTAAQLGVLSDVLAKIVPQQTSAMLNATQLAMAPYGQLTDIYGNAGMEIAKNNTGFDLGALANLDLGKIDWSKLLSSMFGGGTTGNKSYTAMTGMY